MPQTPLFRPREVPKPIELRPYQRTAINELRDLLHQGLRRILIVAPTGAGKTVVFAYLLARFAEQGHAGLVLAHRRELIGQTFDRTVDAGVAPETIGVIMADDPRRNAAAPVQIASVDTLRNRTHKPPASLVVIDECHRALAESYQRIAAEYPDAIHLGFTATPWRKDGKGLGRFYQDVVVVATVSDLIADGYLVRPRVFTHPAGPDLSAVEIRGGDYDEEQLAAAVDKAPLIGNVVEHWKRHAEGVRTVAFAASVEHSQHIAEAFRAAGVAAEHLDGETPKRERDAILARLRSGETLVVSNCAVLTEGWDSPEAKCAILARPTKSKTLYLQCAGRVLRSVPGRPDIDSAVILDHAGCALEHGLPQDPQDYDLDDAPRRRTPVKISVRTCPECFAALPARTQICPECGHVFVPVASPASVPEAVEGQLVEVRRAIEEQLGALRRQIHSAAGRIDAERKWDFGTTNRRLFERYRKHRSEMTALELRAVLSYLTSGAFHADHPAPVPDAPPAMWLAESNQIPAAPDAAPDPPPAAVPPAPAEEVVSAEEVVEWRL